MGRFGLVFPGQGAQHPGMGQDLYRGHQGVRELFAEEGDVLGEDRVSLCFTGPQELLDLAMNPQITALTADLAVWGTFSERVATKPVVMAGHSLGECAAPHAAGAVNLRDVLSLIRAEGATPSGGRSPGRRGHGGHPRPPAGGGGGVVPFKRILSGLIRRIDRHLRLLNIEDAEPLEKTASALNG